MTAGLLRARWLGRVRYTDAAALQRGLWSEGDEDWLLLLEHPHVFTLGVRADPANVLVEPAAVGAELVRADRGGDVTYHGPGQLVGYPIRTVPTGPGSVPGHVHAIEQLVVDALTDVGLPGAGRLDGYPGVWVGADTGNPRKICAIGVRISKGRSMHGFALNVDPDMAYFGHIVPCGIADKPVTSLAAEGVHVGMHEVVDAVVARAAQAFGYTSVDRQDTAWRVAAADLAPFTRGEGPGVPVRGAAPTRPTEPTGPTPTVPTRPTPTVPTEPTGPTPTVPTGPTPTVPTGPTPTVPTRPTPAGPTRPTPTVPAQPTGPRLSARTSAKPAHPTARPVRLLGRLAQAGVDPEGGLALAERKPDWLRVPARMGPEYRALRKTMRELSLVTVCEEAGCPNIYECWADGTATFMINGDRCTRACGFCLVDTRKPLSPDPEEPARVAEAVSRLRLAHAVVTTVARDDLPDDGAGQFAATIEAIHAGSPGTAVEVLISDCRGHEPSLDAVFAAGPEVLAHNVETVPRLQRAVRPSASYARSLSVLARAKGAGLTTKSGLMVGVGERTDEVVATLADLRGVGVDIVTIGQYLRPTSHHLPVARWWRPAEFAALAAAGEAMGIPHVEASPLTRSSYHARAAADAVVSLGKGPAGSTAAAAGGGGSFS